MHALPYAMQECEGETRDLSTLIEAAEDTTGATFFDTLRWAGEVDNENLQEQILETLRIWISAWIENDGAEEGDEEEMVSLADGDIEPLMAMLNAGLLPLIVKPMERHPKHAGIVGLRGAQSRLSAARKRRCHRYRRGRDAADCRSAYRLSRRRRDRLDMLQRRARREVPHARLPRRRGRRRGARAGLGEGAQPEMRALEVARFSDARPSPRRDSVDTNEKHAVGAPEKDR